LNRCSKGCKNPRVQHRRDETIASGDSFNDLGMIQASKAGFLFKSTQAIRADHPELPAFEEFGELLEAIKGAIG